MALCGFTCPKDGSNQKFGDCFNGCKSWCEDIPILLALSEGIRDIKENVYSVTEILNPPKVIYLSRTVDFYLSPYDMVWTTFGSAWHFVIERQKERLRELNHKEYSFEHENFFEVPIEIKEGTITLRGMPDQYNHQTHVLTDYKTLKFFYDLFYIKEKKDWSGSKYHWQVNMYRRFKFPDCKKMVIKALVKDYNRKLKNDKGIKPIETVEVPWIDDEEIDKFVHERAAEILKNLKDPTTIRDCSEQERWKDNIRCHEYCGLAAYCSQYKKLLDKGE